MSTLEEQQAKRLAERARAKGMSPEEFKRKRKQAQEGYRRGGQRAATAARAKQAESFADRIENRAILSRQSGDTNPLVAISAKEGGSAPQEGRKPWEIPRSELAANYSPQPPTNEMRLRRYSHPPEGTLRIDPQSGEVQEFRHLPVARLKSSEAMERIADHPTTQQYVAWAKAGAIMPPVEVVLSNKGGWVSINRRRLHAATQAQWSTLPAWVDYGVEQGNTILRHEDLVRNALERGLPVPDEVLAEYPHLDSEPEREDVGLAGMALDVTTSKKTSGPTR